MIPEGTDAQAVTKDQAQAVIQAINDYVERTRITRTSIARNLNVAASTLGQVLNWKYAGNWQQIILDLDRWLEAQQKSDATPRTSEFVWTTVAQEIKTVADVAISSGQIGLVYGPTTSGIGKTMALRAIRDVTPGSIMITITKAAPTVASMLRDIARELQCPEYGGHAGMQRAIVKKLFQTKRLLIIDQIHSLLGQKGDKPLFVLCDILDATGAPQLWCGTVDVRAYLNRGQAKGSETLAQVNRRIVMAWDLMERTRQGEDGGQGQPLFTIDEIRKVFAKNKIRLAPDASQYLCTLANMEDSGSLGTCVNLVLLATMVAESRGDKVLSAALLRSYHRSLMGGRSFALMERRMSEYHQPIARVG